MVPTEIGTIRANKNKYFFQCLFMIDATSFLHPEPDMNIHLNGICASFNWICKNAVLILTYLRLKGCLMNK